MPRLPRRGAIPFLLDMATSAIPWNRLLLSRTLKMELPADVAVDAHGNYTTDPETGEMLAPLGGSRYGYKGAGLAGMIEIMSAALTGMRFGFEQDGKALGDTELGHLVVAIDPGLLGDAADVASRVAAYIDAAQALSGEGRTVQPLAGRNGSPSPIGRRTGFPLPDPLRVELNRMAHDLGLAGI